MKAFTAVVLGAVIACTQNVAQAFSPAARRSNILSALENLKMTGAGGAASPDSNYVDGESSRI